MEFFVGKAFFAYQIFPFTHAATEPRWEGYLVTYLERKSFPLAKTSLGSEWPLKMHTKRPLKAQISGARRLRPLLSAARYPSLSHLFPRRILSSCLLWYPRTP